MRGLRGWPQAPRTAALAAALVMLTGAASTRTAVRSGPPGTVTPGRARPGDVVLVKVPGRAGSAVNPRVELGTVTLPAWPTQHGHEVLVPVPRDAGPGALALRLVGTRDRAATEDELSAPPLTVQVRERTPEQVPLQVDPRYLHPSEDERARIEQDGVAVRRAYDTSSEALEVTRPFRWPRPEVKVTGRFGDLRLFNGTLESEHEGTDLEASEGDPVRVANDGIVALSRDCFHSGRTIIVDHGGRVFTAYFHLSARQVSAGDRVRNGDQIGLVGNTGRSTAPHLHFAVHVSGEYVDPESFMRLRLDRPVPLAQARR